MGYKVIVLDPNEDCPCRYVAHQFIHANYDDEQALNQLGENSDVVTYEFENISSEQLKTHSVISYSQGTKLLNYYKIG